MYAGIMSGMNAQRKENTSNRRESTKLFNDYLAKTRELGLDLTEEDLAGNWNSNASGVNRKYAPTKDRMQSIISANTDYNDRVAAQQSFDDLVRSQKVDDMVEQMVNKGFRVRLRVWFKLWFSPIVGMPVIMLLHHTSLLRLVYGL